MYLHALGINHKTAPLSLRESLAFSAQRLAHTLKHLRRTHPALGEATLLSTCNRTELYSNSPHPDALIQWFHAQCPSLQQTQQHQHLYTYQNQDAVRHMMRVACGLDSMVLGEPQILGQMKHAYAQAKAAGTTGPYLDQLFPAIFSTTKHIRTQTRIGHHPVSFGYTAQHLAQRIFTDLNRCNVLLIGAGRMIRSVAPYFAKPHKALHHRPTVWIANRSTAHAHTLAESLQLPTDPAPCIRLDTIPHQLTHADIIIAAIDTELPLIGKGCIEHAMKQRKQRPLFIVDLGVPRNVEAEVHRINNVYCYNIDDLGKMVHTNQQLRQSTASEAEAIINTQALHFMQSIRTQKTENTQTIRNYRTRAETLRDQALQKAQCALQAGKSPDAVCAELAHSLTNKILHIPTVNMRQAAYQGNQDVMEALDTLFQDTEHGDT